MMKLCYDNAADRSTLVASATASLLAASNLLNNIKSQVWRSSGTSATLTLTWPVPETVALVALAFTSLTAAATMRVRGYADGGMLALFDTGTQFAPGVGGSVGTAQVIDAQGKSYPGQRPAGWGAAPLGVNSYSRAGGGYCVAYFGAQQVKSLVIDIDDPTNPLGYIEAGRIIAGDTWQPVHDAEIGSTIAAHDDSKHTRTDAGDLRTEIGPQYKGITLNLQYMPPGDRDTFWNILRRNGVSNPVFLSLMPSDQDQTGEAICQLFGKLTKTNALAIQYLGAYSTTLDMEEV